MSEPRPPILTDIERAVRRKCNFGCINPECRCPIWDYEHIIDYAVVQEHREENIVLLCPTCNQARKGAQFPRSLLAEWLKEISKQTKPERLYYHQPTIHLGGNVYPSGQLTCGSVFRIGRNSFSFSHEEDFTLIDGEFYNKHGELSMRIEKSRYTLYSDTWDIDYNRGHRTKRTPGVLTFRNSLGDVFLEVCFEAEANLLIIAGKFYFSPGHFIHFNGRGIFHGSTLLARACIVQATRLGFWVCDQNVPFSSIARESAVRNVRNVEACRIMNSTIGFVWDHDFLLHPERVGYLNGLRCMEIKAVPLTSLSSSP